MVILLQVNTMSVCVCFCTSECAGGLNKEPGAWAAREPMRQLRFWHRIVLIRSSAVAEAKC